MGDPVLRATWQSLRLSAKAAQGVAQAAVAGIEHAQERRGVRAARRGLVGPDDPPPPPEWTAGILDYRGLARPRELAASGWTYRLGRPRNPTGHWSLNPAEVGLTDGGIVRHAAVIGPTRSGKTSSIAAPWIYGALRSGRSVVAVDVAGDLWASLRRYGATQGPLNVEVFHWDCRDPARSSSWRWVDDLDGRDAVEAAAEAIVAPGWPNEPAHAARRRATGILSELLPLVRGTAQASAGALLDLLADRRKLAAFVARLPPGAQVGHLRELLSVQPGRYLETVSDLLERLQPLDTPELRRVSEAPGLSLEMLTGKPTLLIVGSASYGAQTSDTALGLVLAVAARRWLRGFPGTPAMMVLDEAPRIQDHIHLPTLLSTGASVGLAVVLCAQDVSQFAQTYRDEILSNCATMAMLPGCGPSSTAYFSKRLGQRPVVELSRSVQRTSPWSAPQRALSTSSQMVEMLGHREISSPPFEGYPAIVHAATVHPRPILVDLTRPDL